MAVTFEDYYEPMKRAILDPSAYKTCTPVWEFNFVVVGAKSDGRIQVAKIGYDEEIKSWTQYNLLTQSQALETMTKVKTKPQKLHKALRELEFLGKNYVHWISHGDNDAIASTNWPSSSHPEGEAIVDSLCVFNLCLSRVARALYLTFDKTTELSIG
jgi:hypothetical protein